MTRFIDNGVLYVPIQQYIVPSDIQAKNSTESQFVKKETMECRNSVTI